MGRRLRQSGGNIVIFPKNYTMENSDFYTNWKKDAINKREEFVLQKLNSLEELDKELKKHQIIQIIKANWLREKYTKRLYIVTLIWSFIVIVFTFLQSIGCIRLDNTVLIVFITSTTLNVFAFFLLVIKYLFPNRVNS